MKRFFLSLSLLLCTVYSYASIRDVKKMHPIVAGIPVRIGGYVSAEFFWDTRQVVGSDEDEYLLFPEPKKLDPLCRDINAKGQYMSTALQSRVRLEANGPHIKHAKSSAVIEGDFFGRNDVANIFRLRHAFLKLDWENFNLLAGQYWHPLYVVGVDPRTVSFNSGAPLDTFARSPQIRLTYEPLECLHMLVAASTQLASPSDGPIGPSTTYLRNSAIPRLDFRIDGIFKNAHIGAGIDWKLIQPRLETNDGYKTDERLNSIIAEVYGSFTWGCVNTRSKVFFYQNATDLSIIGGYAVSCIETNDFRKYTNLNGIGFWNDTQLNKSKTLIPGWFIGVAKNLGARKTILQNVEDANGVVTEKRIYGTGTNLDYVFRFSPRVLWVVNNFTLGVELEYTRAAYGTIDCDGDVIDTTPVGNTRLLASLYYYF